MSAVAHVAHATRGRARLRLPSAKGDKPTLDRIAEGLRQCPTIDKVSVNLATASVLVHYGGELETILVHAREHDLFEVREKAARPDALVRVRDVVLDVNTALRRHTEGAV
ncbi:MAG TPA: hypothetical protein VM580_08405, partial [Labilithrix sp.]|nr:hypothetical protein [Labilithrix sp.]